MTGHENHSIGHLQPLPVVIAEHQAKFSSQIGIQLWSRFTLSTGRGNEGGSQRVEAVRVACVSFPQRACEAFDTRLQQPQGDCVLL